jgi:hypothetical protein
VSEIMAPRFRNSPAEKDRRREAIHKIALSVAGRHSGDGVPHEA